VPPQIQRLRSDDLLASVFPDVAACQENIEGDIKIPDHPLVREVMKDVLTEALDIEGLSEVLRGIERGRIRCLAVDTPVPSQFSHEILNANPYAYLDDAPLEERRARAVEMRRVLPASVLEEVGALDPAAIAQVQQEAWPDVRDADELHDVLHTLVLMLVESTQQSAVSNQLKDRGPKLTANWNEFFDRLQLENRAVVVEAASKQYWLAAERQEWFQALHPVETRLAASPAANQTTGDARRDAASCVSTVSFDDAVLTAVQGWIAHLGPTTASEIGDLLGLPASEIEKALLRIEASGAILRGKFRPADSRPTASASQEPETEWCERRLLARIHRLTVATLRKQIAPVTASQFMNWLLRWQHIAPGTQVRGEHGTLEVIRQLQGFEIPASAWERFVLARRISDYDPAHLDQLCMAGVVGWGRLSPHPATLEATGNDENGRENRRRVIPTRVAPIAFFVREDADWLRPHHPGAEDSATSFLSPVAQAVLELLKQRGALFFPDMVRATGRLKAEIETGLWELVAAGLVTADGFENLRSLVTPKSTAGNGLARVIGKARRPRHAPGRWSLLHTEGADRDRSVESCCWMLLRRYGVVFRDLLLRETNLPRWRELQIGYRRLEDRSEVRGGRFVDGFLGEQFALPVAVESLRAQRKLPPNANSERVTIAAADPLNLVGIIVPGERIPAISGRSVTFRDGMLDAEDALLASGY
jgi:ATP-dependent Lhr-like helicase